MPPTSITIAPRSLCLWRLARTPAPGFLADVLPRRRRRHSPEANVFLRRLRWVRLTIDVGLARRERCTGARRRCSSAGRCAQTRLFFPWRRHDRRAGRSVSAAIARTFAQSPLNRYFESQRAPFSLPTALCSLLPAPWPILSALCSLAHSPCSLLPVVAPSRLHSCLDERNASLLSSQGGASTWFPPPHFVSQRGFTSICLPILRLIPLLLFLLLYPSFPRFWLLSSF